MNDRFEQTPRIIMIGPETISVKWDWNWEVDEILDALEDGLRDEINKGM